MCDRAGGRDRALMKGWRVQCRNTHTHFRPKRAQGNIAFDKVLIFSKENILNNSYTCAFWYCYLYSLFFSPLCFCCCFQHDLNLIRLRSVDILCLSIRTYSVHVMCLFLYFVYLFVCVCETKSLKYTSTAWACVWKCVNVVGSLLSLVFL